MKEAIIEHEHLVLRIIAFDTTADLPHAYILNIAKQMQLENQEVKFAWMFMNDSFRNRRVISTPPAVIACACLYLGILLKSKAHVAINKKILLPSREYNDGEEGSLAKWWGLYGISDAALWDAAEWISISATQQLPKAH